MFFNLRRRVRWAAGNFKTGVVYAATRRWRPAKRNFRAAWYALVD